MAEGECATGHYHLADGEVRRRVRSREGRPFELPVCGDGDVMAVAYHLDGTLCACGEASEVEARADTLAQCLAEAYGDGAPHILVRRFMPTAESLAELNACIDVSGRVLRFEAALALMDGVDEAPPPSLRH